MARPAYGGRNTCESCISIDVRRWHRQGRLQAGQYFSWSWTRGGEPAGSIRARTEWDAVVLIYRSRGWGATEWKSIEQRVPITWTACHLGGQRPWFVCAVYSNGRYCGRRAAILYGAGELFACRRCYGLAYASQQERPMQGAPPRPSTRNTRFRASGPKRATWTTSAIPAGSRPRNRAPGLMPSKVFISATLRINRSLQYQKQPETAGLNCEPTGQLPRSRADSRLLFAS